MHVGPFHWAEALRSDVRARSPFTRSTFLLAPAAPLIRSAEQGFTVLASYRRDSLRQGIGALHRLEAGGLYNLRLRSDWTLNVDARAVVASDFGHREVANWFPSLRAGATWHRDQSLSVSLGALWTRTNFGLVPLPLLGVYYRPAGGRIRIDALLPRYVEVALLAGRSEVFISGHWETLLWRTGGDETRAFLSRMEVRAVAGLRVRLVGPLALEASAHWTPFQRLERGALQDSRTSLGDIGVSAALIIDTDEP